MTQVNGILGKSLLEHADKIIMPKGIKEQIDPGGVSIVKMSFTINKGMAYRLLLLGKLINKKHPEEIQITIPTYLYPTLVKPIPTNTSKIQ